MKFEKQKDDLYKVTGIKSLSYTISHIKGSLLFCLENIIGQEKQLRIEGIEHITLEGYSVIQPMAEAA